MPEEKKKISPVKKINKKKENLFCRIEKDKKGEFFFKGRL